MIRNLYAAVMMLVFMTVLTGVLYPLTVTGVAVVALPHQAHGSLLVHDGRLIGSSLIGQPFDDPEYFWGRLSATGPFPYNAAASSGSNYGPRDTRLKDAIASRVKALRDADPQLKEPIPADLITTSASGLDPHVSPAAAAIQIRRVAMARDISEERVKELVVKHTQDRQIGILGEPTVAVLPLNLELDQVAPLVKTAGHVP